MFTPTQESRNIVLKKELCQLLSFLFELIINYYYYLMNIKNMHNKNFYGIIPK